MLRPSLDRRSASSAIARESPSASSVALSVVHAFESVGQFLDGLTKPLTVLFVAEDVADRGIEGHIGSQSCASFAYRIENIFVTFAALPVDRLRPPRRALLVPCCSVGRAA
jgi:hypothetical protein